ncbi:hypothetical protein DQ353_16405 [Arthrobacter sp. AQ5-05]|uniref:hypothetical protein n=1 Tax=Arthrobacter sp. AQ5-05 TaxID=2184581 RepID=UPI000DCD4FA8|nr:hypothetical protein [Arthrobacter sp. AQ5-05]RAX48169.1 hypothetical protein DQ353_16405 [Arthrobacter sp. AQ5-05]
MTADTASVTRRALSERLRWVIGLLVFAAACYAVFGWLYDRELRDASGNRLVFYLGWQDGEFAALAFVLGGLAVGAVLLLLGGPLVARIRNTAVFVIVQLLLFAVGTVLFLFWAVACLVIMMGAGMGSMDLVTATDGKRVLLERSVVDGDITAVWVPHSWFMYAELPDSGFPIGKYLLSEDCTLEPSPEPWVLTCQGIEVVLERNR